MKEENTFIKFTEATKGKIKIRLQKNNLARKNSDRFYGKVERNTFTTQNVLNRLSQVIPHIDLGTAVTVLNAYTQVIEKILEEGNAVKLGNIGTFYIATKGSVGCEEEKPDLTVKFTASKELKETVKNMEIVSSEYKKPKGSIEKITDVMTGKEDGTITQGSPVILKGSRIKVGGEKGGIFLAPLGRNGFLKDEEEWIKVDSKLICNTPTKLLFTLPQVAEEGKYKIVVRTHFATRTKYARKEAFDTVSEEVNFKRRA